MKKAILAVFCLICIFRVAECSGGGTESPFTFGAGAHELAMGGTGLIICDANTAVYWNPSRLTKAERFSVGSFYSRFYMPGISFQYLGLAIPTLDYGNFGAGVFRLGVDDIEKRDAGNLLLGKISEQRLGFYLGYATTIAGFDFGSSLNIENHSLDSYKATSSPGFNMAISRQIETSLRRIPIISLALNGQNIVKPSMKVVDENVKYPSALNFGIGITTLPIPEFNHKFLIASEIRQTNGIDPRFSFGIEYSYSELLFLRGGIQGDNPSFGAGLHYSLFNFDYALVKRDLGYLNVFNLTASFGSSISERKTDRTARREAEFNKIMRRQMENQAQSTIKVLTEEGAKLRSEGRLDDAIVNYDRALFLAKSNNIDTTSIAAKASALRGEIERSKAHRQYQEFFANARQKYMEKDLLAARFFAEKAIAVFPDSGSCRKLLDQIDKSIREIQSTDELVNKRIWIADSLLGYNRIDQAYAVIEAAAKLVPGDSRLAVSMKRIKLEKYREIAITAVASGQLNKALVVADSALTLFPKHNYFIDLRTQLRDSLASLNYSSSSKGPTSQITPNKAMMKEVDRSYAAAKELYEIGNLGEAISEWEKIELLIPNYLQVRKYLIDSYKYSGIQQYGQNHLREAISLWQKAMKLDPNNVEISRYLERAEFEMKQAKELSYGTNN